MNKIALTTLAAVAGLSVSFAGSIASADTDWSGIYAGGYYSTGTGEDYNLGGPWPLKDDGSFYGGFAGYRHDLGSYVIGGELASSFGVDVGEAIFTTWIVNSVLDMKITAGYDLGSILPYAIIGYSMAEADPGPYSVAGMLYGVGADWMITDSIFIGAEYNNRFMEGTTNSYTIELESYLVRAGYRF